MAVDTSTVQIVMPAMGDSVAEGTILEWHKQEGDHVGHLRQGAETPERELTAQEGREVLGVLPLEGVPATAGEHDRSGADRVHPDAVGRQLLRRGRSQGSPTRISSAA